MIHVFHHFGLICVFRHELTRHSCSKLLAVAFFKCGTIVRDVYTVESENLINPILAIENFWAFLLSLEKPLHHKSDARRRFEHERQRRYQIS